MNTQRKIKFPIVVKLSGIIVALLLISTLLITYRSSNLVEKITGPRERDVLGAAAQAKAEQVNVILDKYRDKTRLVAALLLKDKNQNISATESQNEAQTNAQSMQDDAISLSFYNDPDFVSIEIFELKNSVPQSIAFIQKNQYFEKLNLPVDYLKNLRAMRPFPLAKVFGGDLVIRNSSAPGGANLLTMGLPFVKNNLGVITHVAVCDLRLDGLQKPFSQVTDRAYYLVDSEGNVIAHPNDQFVISSKNLKNEEIVSKALASKVLQGEAKYYDPTEKKNFIGSFAKTHYGPSVIARSAEDIILEPVRFLRRQAFLITGLVLSGAIFFVFLFSMSITTPIEKLVDVMRLVTSGNFEVKAETKSHDEIGLLSDTFNMMTVGLKERDKIKNLMTKFHGSVISEDLMKSDLQLGGVNKQVTVFFSDIRGFTNFSEGHSPEKVVSMLNEYFEIMVKIITKNHGVVDKFVGDAIMAIWGAPHSTGKDEIYAVKSCLEMRAALAELNQRRVARGEVEIKIGMGLNSGPVISGTIGSTERMEYTVIGDTVNTASRIESATKEFHVDMLVSESVLEKVKDSFIFEYAGAAEVKGKSEPLNMYKIIDEQPA